MKKYIKVMMAFVLGLLMIGCDEDAMFREELYDKYIYIVSNEEQIHNLLFSLNKDKDMGTVSVACSGTQKIDNDVQVTLEKDKDILGKYNYSNFDINEEKYAKELKNDSYEMPQMNVLLRHDDIDPYATLPIVIKQEALSALSPDSTYFIPLRIKDVSGYQIKEEKRNVLCRIYTYNEYANTKEATQYTMKGYRIIGDNSSSISGYKNVHPINANSVRMFVANTKFEANEKIIAKNAVTVEVQKDNSIKMYPYIRDTKTLEVHLMTPPNDSEEDFIYQNVYEKKNERFLLYYKYRTRDNENSWWSEWIVVKEATKRLNMQTK